MLALLLSAVAVANVGEGGALHDALAPAAGGEGPRHALEEHRVAAEFRKLGSCLPFAAAAADDPDLLEYLASAGIDLSAGRSGDGVTPMIVAAAKSKMSFKMRKNSADVAAYLATFSD